MAKPIILLVGTGRCGLRSLAELLNLQSGIKITVENAPLVPWEFAGVSEMFTARFERFRREPGTEMVGDAAASYLPHVDEILKRDPDVRIVGLFRTVEETVASFARFLAEVNAIPINHWAESPAPGWYHHPIRTRCFPQYSTPDPFAGLHRYCHEYTVRLHELQAAHPNRVRCWTMQEALYSQQSQHEILEFLGIPRSQHVIATGIRSNSPKIIPVATRLSASTSLMSPDRCVVLVPYLGFIHPPCENGLRELEKRGYTVRRVGGFSAIDQGRNQLATDALQDGFEETMWIDSDVEFHPNAVDQLRSHGLPISCGIYPQKGPRALACHVMPGSTKMIFGKAGGLCPLLYAGAGFLHVRRRVYEVIQRRLKLPVTNERFGGAMVPWFQSMLHPIEDGLWYLAEDYAFCERARQCGFQVTADTSIRLWHHGSYGYGWEDSGVGPERVESFTLFMANAPEASIPYASIPPEYSIPDATVRPIPMRSQAPDSKPST